jgi:RNA polymerase sigma factor (sigma-70 family)
LSRSESTCWTVVRGAALGSINDREEFARRYLPVVRAYLAARWRDSAHLRQLDDAVQEVFLECFRHDGALRRAEPQRGFRPFLYGVVRNIARRVERGGRVPTDAAIDPDQSPGDEDDLARAFDRTWARAILRETALAQEANARAAGPEAMRRVELLRLRFHEGLPIREIAVRWKADAADLHREYARARQEFRAALAGVVAFHQPGTPAEVERSCTELLAMLG